MTPPGKIRASIRQPSFSWQPAAPKSGQQLTFRFLSSHPQGLSRARRRSASPGGGHPDTGASAASPAQAAAVPLNSSGRKLPTAATPRPAWLRTHRPMQPHPLGAHPASAELFLYSDRQCLSQRTSASTSVFPTPGVQPKPAPEVTLSGAACDHRHTAAGSRVSLVGPDPTTSRSDTRMARYLSTTAGF